MVLSLFGTKQWDDWRNRKYRWWNIKAYFGWLMGFVALGLSLTTVDSSANFHILRPNNSTLLTTGVLVNRREFRPIVMPWEQCVGIPFHFKKYVDITQKSTSGIVYTHTIRVEFSTASRDPRDFLWLAQPGVQESKVFSIVVDDCMASIDPVLTKLAANKTPDGFADHLKKSEEILLALGPPSPYRLRSCEWIRCTMEYSK